MDPNVAPRDRMQKLIRTWPAVLLLAVLGVGCEALGINTGRLGEDDRLRYTFQTQQSRFTVADTVDATFTNRSSEAVYVSPGCPPMGLEKRTGSSWTTVEIPIGCLAVALPPMTVEPGERLERGLLPWMLEAAEMEPGTYRLSLPIGRSQEEPSEQATSNRFAVVR